MPGPSTKIDWTQWGHLLGKFRDAVVAKKVSAVSDIPCTADMVRRQRRTRRISPSTGLDPESNCGKVNWERYAFYLGSMQDGSLARKIATETGVGITAPAVRSARIRRGVPAFKGKDPKAIPNNASTHMQGAQRRDMTLVAYMERINANEKYCPRCEDWHKRKDFAEGSNRGRGEICKAFRESRKKAMTRICGVTPL